MIDKPDGGASASDEQFEGPGELFEPLNKLRQISNFGKTLAAVMRGETLYDFDRQRLQREGYLGPWQFNALQSTLSGLPAVIIPFGARLIGVSRVAEDGKLNEFLQSFGLPFIPRCPREPIRYTPLMLMVIFGAGASFDSSSTYTPGMEPPGAGGQRDDA